VEAQTRQDRNHLKGSWVSETHQTSILGTARLEGYRDAWGQASQVNHDQAYCRGFQDGQKESPSRAIWFALGILVGPLISYLHALIM
jgi:hypothetical protein